MQQLKMFSMFMILFLSFLNLWNLEFLNFQFYSSFSLLLLYQNHFPSYFWLALTLLRFLPYFSCLHYNIMKQSLPRIQYPAILQGHCYCIRNNSGKQVIPPGQSRLFQTGYLYDSQSQQRYILIHPSTQLYQRGLTTTTDIYGPQDDGKTIWKKIWNYTKQNITVENGLKLGKVILQYLPQILEIIPFAVISDLQTPQFVVKQQVPLSNKRFNKKKL